jgi:hypothetical protein
LARLEGRAAVTEPELSDWRAAQSCYGPGAPASREAAFLRLIEAAIAEEAMRRHGAPALSEEDLARDAERIDRETSAPDVLACVKAGFGSRRERYLAVFVRPALVESRLRELIGRERHGGGAPGGPAAGLGQEGWLRASGPMNLDILDPGLKRWIRGIRGNPRLAAVRIL